MKNRYFLLSILIAAILGGCQPTIEEFSPKAGDANFSTYIAVGNSLTAGYADGALYKSGQEYSYPNMLAEQFKKVGGGEFKQPLMLDDLGIGFSGVQPITKRILGYPTDCLGKVSLGPVLAGQPDMANLASIADQGPFNNIAVPGIKVIHMVVPGYGNLNPYYGRFMSAATNAVVDEIPKVDATFFTMALGSNDVLGYAGSGGEGDVITPIDQFEAAFRGVLDALMANGANGAVVNVPNPLHTPFFNTIPYNPIVITEQANADLLNAAYAPLNQIIVGAGSTDTIFFALGQNPMVIADATLPWGLRQINPDELVLMTLPQDSLKCAGWGTQKPVPSYYVLDRSEVDLINETVKNYNLKILEIVIGKPVAFIDVYSLIKEIYDKGLTYDGVNYNATFATGNFYSTDGLHATPAGYAIMCNGAIDAINTAFNANVPQVIVSDYPANIYPE
jgi:lysophospholipase L1-like esterase